ncbi:MAG: hypothetical protein A3K10_10265 [Bacteroidetes bacterium RIFCSPLOWO2_12_FULL_31_6]|nr:MAG: hypothetical protein A3K10_10265 [Bacteroidetes bacterium RIFCSPLOWO2_12_FULL_31_6]
MKLFRKITSLVLAVAIFNIIASSAVHEMLEHHFQVHACIDKAATHFHKLEIQHQDLICSFNFSSSFINNLKNPLANLFLHLENKITVRYFFLAKNLYLHAFLLRGPPSIK